MGARRLHPKSNARARKEILIQHRIGEDVHVHEGGIFDFIAAATAAAAGVLDVIESFLGIDHDEASVDFEAFDIDLPAVFLRQARDAVHDGKNRVGHRNLFQRIFREANFDFLAKGLVPFLIRTTGADEKEPALGEIFSQLLALFLRERKTLVAGHDAEREIEKRIGVEADGAESRVHAQVGLLGDVFEKIVGEANGAFVAGVNQVAALEESQVGVDGRSGRVLLCERRCGEAD